MKHIISFIFILQSISIQSCTCINPSDLTQDEIKHVGEAFIGVITKVDTNFTNQTITATFELKKHLIGKLNNEIYRVTTNIDGASCGLKFIAGQKWYMFAYYSDDKELYSSLCSRSVQLNKVSQKNKRFIIGTKNYRIEKRRYRADKKAIKN